MSTVRLILLGAVVAIFGFFVGYALAWLILLPLIHSEPVEVNSREGQTLEQRAFPAIAPPVTHLAIDPEQAPESELSRRIAAEKREVAERRLAAAAEAAQRERISRSSDSTQTVPQGPSPNAGGQPEPPAVQGSVWDRLAACESGGNWHINTGNGYYGGLQFSLQSWQWVGGTGYPHEHPRETQIAMGERLRQRQGWGAWPSCSRQLGLR